MALSVILNTSATCHGWKQEHGVTIVHSGIPVRHLVIDCDLAVPQRLRRLMPVCQLFEHITRGLYVERNRFFFATGMFTENCKVPDRDGLAHEAAFNPVLARSCGVLMLSSAAGLG